MGERSQASWQVTEASTPEEELQTCRGLPLSKGDLLQEGWWYHAGVSPPPSLWVSSMEATTLFLMECCAWEWPGPQLQWEPH